MIATARYLHLKSQELHEALMTVHETIGFEKRPQLSMLGPSESPSSRTNS